MLVVPPRCSPLAADNPAAADGPGRRRRIQLSRGCGGNRGRSRDKRTDGISASSLSVGLHSGSPFTSQLSISSVHLTTVDAGQLTDQDNAFIISDAENRHRLQTEPNSAAAETIGTRDWLSNNEVLSRLAPIMLDTNWEFCGRTMQNNACSFKWIVRSDCITSAALVVIRNAWLCICWIS